MRAFLLPLATAWKCSRLQQRAAPFGTRAMRGKMRGELTYCHALIVFGIQIPVLGIQSGVQVRTQIAEGVKYEALEEQVN